MAIIETKYSPQEALRRIHHIIEVMNKHLREHALHNVFNRISSDIRILGDERTLRALLSKFDDASLKQFYADARNLGHLAKTHHRYIPHIKHGLKRIEELLIMMRKAQILEIRKARFLGRLATHLSREVMGIEREVHITQQRIERQIRSFSRMPIKIR